MIAAETRRSLHAAPASTALAEYGSLDSARLSGRYAVRTGRCRRSAAAGWQRSDGIDSFGGGGERDGFDNLAASLQIEARPSRAIRLGVVGHWVEGTSDYDGFDPLTFLRADTLRRDQEPDRRGARLGERANGAAGRSRAEASPISTAPTATGSTARR